ncbi:MAG TPA: RNA 2'-phosphotransferase [Pseudolysinimonas sp.]|jgi:putative RNA 2'-phosphotransferase
MTPFDGNLVALSRTVSHALRHEPEAYGLVLDSEGWVDVNVLLAAIGKKNESLQGATEQQLVEILATSEKTRFEVRDRRARARYGHSVKQKIDHQRVDEPPRTLFHGTAARNRDSILEKGLLPSGRQFVHLSGDRALAMKVGRRHGDPIVFLVDTAAAQAQGIQFFIVDDDVYLADRIPAAALTLDRTADS